MKHDKEVQKAIEDKFGKLYKSGKTIRDHERYSKNGYNEWLQQDHPHSKGEIIKANPDILSEDDTLFKPRRESCKKNYTFIIRNIDILTKKEKKVLEYLASGYTMEATGKKLGCTISAIESFLIKIRNKFHTAKLLENSSSTEINNEWNKKNSCS